MAKPASIRFGGTLIDMTGQRFGRLVVIGLTSGTHNGRRRWFCRCDCGQEAVVIGKLLRKGLTRSCGCLRKEQSALNGKTYSTTHGESSRSNKTPEWVAWKAMRDRCLDPAHRAYPSYGGRGITICDRWVESYPNFLEDMGRRPSSGHSLEREDNDRGYSPDKCKWATRVEQCNNRRTNKFLEFAGRRLSISQWAREIGATPNAIFLRLHQGWSIERTLSTPGQTRNEARVKPLSGRFGRWLVLGRAGTKGRNVYWHCRCDCGVEREVSGHSLRNGGSLSCGCLQRETAAEMIRKRNRT